MRDAGAPGAGAGITGERSRNSKTRLEKAGLHTGEEPEIRGVAITRFPHVAGKSKT
jgi:hypothetical protein